MRLNNGQQPIDITTLSQKAEAKFMWVPDYIWEIELNRIMQITDLEYLANELRYVAWLDKGRIPKSLLDGFYDQLLYTAHHASTRDRRLNSFLALQTIFGQTKQEMLFNGSEAEGTVGETLQRLTRPMDSEGQLRALGMALKLKLLGQDITTLEKTIASYEALLRNLITRDEPLQVLDHYSSLFVIIRFLFPEWFSELDLEQYSLGNPEDILAKFAHEMVNGGSPNYLMIAANLRMVHAQDIQITDTGIIIIDNTIQADSNYLTLPPQITI